MRHICLILFLFFEIIVVASEYVVPKYVHSVTCSDIDLDNDIDIVVGSSNNNNDTLSIFRNENGNFSVSYLDYENYYVLLSGDIDGNNYPDLITALSGWNYCYYANDGFGNFSFQAEIFHQSLSEQFEELIITDTNNDGDNDIVFRLHNVNSYWGICTNNGYGEFSEEVYYTIDGILTNLSIGKINNDELVDILIARSFGAQVFYNNINTFEEVVIDSFDANYSYVMDMDNNDYNDLILYAHSFFSNIPCRMKILYNNMENNFAAGDTIEFPSGTIIEKIEDFNNDGYPDLLYTISTWDENAESIFISFHNQTGSFQPPDEYYIGNPQWFKFSTADLDSNGYEDIVVSGYYDEDSNHAVRILFNDGSGSFVEEPQVSSEDNIIISSNEYKLISYPNPFNPITTISYNLPSNIDNPVIEIFNIKGQRIKTFNCQNQIPITWDGKDKYQNQVSSGIYLYRIKSDDFESKTKKMLLLK